MDCLQGLQVFEAGSPFTDSTLYQVLATSSVSVAERYIVDSSSWKRLDGSAQVVVIVGFNPGTGFGGPWKITAGSIRDLKATGTVLIDELYRAELGITDLGQTVEINGLRARVVGYTQGVRSFTSLREIL